MGFGVRCFQVWLSQTLALLQVNFSEPPVPNLWNETIASCRAIVGIRWAGAWLTSYWHGTSITKMIRRFPSLQFPGKRVWLSVTYFCSKAGYHFTSPPGGSIWGHWDFLPAAKAIMEKQHNIKTQLVSDNWLPNQSSNIINIFSSSRTCQQYLICFVAGCYMIKWLSSLLIPEPRSQWGEKWFMEKAKSNGRNHARHGGLCL